MKIDLLKKQNPETFFISNNLKLVGDIKASMSGRIEGFVRGDVFVNGKLIVGQNAVVIGNIQAEDILVYGKIYGNILGVSSVKMAADSKIEGDIISVSIEIDKDAMIDGDIKKMKIQDVKKVDLPRRKLSQIVEKEIAKIAVIKKVSVVSEVEDANAWW